MLLRRSTIKKLSFFTAGICLGFFQTVLLIPDSCAQAPAPQASGPIDIQANEQEFAESVVLAKGNVTVTYKDSVVKAPEAKLYRDEAGQPQKAVFVGHPFLTQNDNKISADTLIFEIANSKFIAQGNAHSEVLASGNETQVDPKAAPKKDVKTADKAENKLENKAGSKNVLATKGEKAKTNTKQPFAWPQASDDQSDFQNPSTSKIASSNIPVSKTQSEQKNGQPEPEKIITDSDYQEYEKDSGKFDATGHVHVIHGNISVFADKLKLVYGLDNKPETALFTGHVNAFQESNNTQADMVTYYLSTKRLQATGNVRSRMIQQKPNESGTKSASNKKVIGAKPNAGGATAAPSTLIPQASDDPIIVVSDAQDINQNTGKMSADGNVRVYYQEIVGVGPKVLLLRNPDGRAEKVIFTERSQISQPGKRWIADRITMAIATKKILAEGNTKALIIQGSPAGQRSPQPALAMRASTNKSAPAMTNNKNRNGTAIGSNKSEIY